MTTTCVYPMSLIACLLSNTLKNLDCNCLVLQSGEWRKTTIGRDTADGTEAVEGLSLHEMELATHTENMLLVSDVGAGCMRSARHWCNRHDAEEVRMYTYMYIHIRGTGGKNITRPFLLISEIPRLYFSRIF